MTGSRHSDLPREPGATPRFPCNPASATRGPSEAKLWVAELFERSIHPGAPYTVHLHLNLSEPLENAVFRCVEVTAGMVPAAGALQRLAERVGRGRASRFVMLGEPISAPVADQLGIATQVVPEAELAQIVEAMAQRLAIGPTKSYAATRTLLKAWSFGGVPAADAVMLEVVTDLFNTEDCTRAILNRAEAIDRGVEPPDMVFNNR